MLWEPYPSHHNGLFLSLLVLRDFAAREADQYRCYPTSYLFYVTLSFLCNIICYLISVFAFSLVTLSGATTYWRRGTRTKKRTLQQAKGVNRSIYWRRYIATTKRYLLQVVKESTTKFLHTTNRIRFLLNKNFTLQTDHKPLITIFGSKKGRSIYITNRQLRWGTILLNYNFKIEYLPSKQISHADGLSRLVPKYSKPFEDTIIAALRTDCEIKNMIANTIKNLPEIKSKAMNDDFITNIKQKITAKKRKSTRSIFTMWQHPPI